MQLDARAAGLRLVSAKEPAPGDASRPSRRSALALWHLLSLDAPTVATLWTVFVAQCAGIRLPWAAPVAMFLAVWMLYAADRLLDARPLADGSEPAELEERHRFHHRHRREFLWALGLTAGSLGGLLPRLDPAALRLYVTLGALLAAWLLLVHARPTHHVLRLPKELAVGVFFSAAVYIPTVARVPALRPELLPAAVFTGAVCILNCLYLYAWEHPGTAGSVRVGAAAHASTLWSVAHVERLTMVIVAAAAAAAVVLARWGSAAGGRGSAQPTAAAAMSGLLLLGLHRRRERLSAVHLRAAADLALLTPALFLLLRCVRR